MIIYLPWNTYGIRALAPKKTNIEFPVNAFTKANSRADDGDEKETVWLHGACAQRDKFGEELSAWLDVGEKSERATKEEIYV